MSGEWREFPAKQDAYEEMLAFVMEAAEDEGVPLKRQMKLQLGFEEAVVNIISYAYEPGVEGKVWLKVYEDAGDMVLELRDSGVPFNPLMLDDALEKKPQSLDDMKVGGLGVAFMRRIFSEINYHYGEEDGLYCNHLTLKFKIAGEGGSS